MYQNFVIAFVLYVLFKSYRRFRQGHLTTARMVMWILFWAAVVAVSWAPQLESARKILDGFSQMVGIDRGVDLVFFAGILLLTYLLAMVYAQLEQTRQEITDLVRELALRDRQH